MNSWVWGGRAGLRLATVHHLQLPTPHVRRQSRPLRPSTATLVRAAQQHGPAAYSAPQPQPQQAAAAYAAVPTWQQVPPPHAGYGRGGAPAQRGLLGFWLPVLMVFCMMLFSLAASFVAFVFYIRPILKAAERAAAAAEQAAVQMEVAAREMEKAALVMSGDLPVTLLEIEKAGKEFGALGQQLNAWTRILARTPAAPGGAGGGGDREGEGGGESGGGAATAERSALQKVVEDAVTLTNARGWIAKWRSRTVAAAAGVGEAGGPGSLPPAPPRPVEEAALREQWRPSAPWEQPVKRRATPALAALEGEGEAAEAGGAQPGEARSGAAAAAAGGNEEQPGEAAAGFQGSSAAMKAAVVAQLKAREGIGTEEERAAAAAVLSAIDRAQEAAQEAASATGVLEAAINKAEAKGALGRRLGGK